MYGDISIEDLKTDSYQASTRNKLLAEALYLTNDIEKYGSGFNRVRNAVATYPTMKFVYKEVSNAFVAELEYTQQKMSTAPLNDGLNDGLSDGLNDGLNEKQRRVFNYIKENQGVQIKIISEELEIPIDTLDRYVKNFVSKKLIERRGSKKTGGYFVKG